MLRQVGADHIYAHSYALVAVQLKQGNSCDCLPGACNMIQEAGD